jgi:hypothetical protein
VFGDLCPVAVSQCSDDVLTFFPFLHYDENCDFIWIVEWRAVSKVLPNFQLTK